MLALVEQTLSGEIQIARIEGDVGHGKTTTLAQFVKKHPETAFSLFIKATSRLAYDFTLLMFDLCNQINWVLTREELDPSSEVDDGTIRTLVLKLQQLARRNRRVYYFVIDGLEDIPSDADYVRTALLDILPFGLSNFKFVVSSTASSTWFKGRGTSKSLPLPFFGLPETVDFLGDTNLAAEIVGELHRTCFGVPGRLAGVKRLLASGIDANKIMDEVAKKDGLLELEWTTVHSADDIDRELLALLALDDAVFSVANLVAIFKQDSNSIRRRLSGFRFLNVAASNESPIEFVSATFKKFAEGKLIHLRQQASERVIDLLVAQPESDDALTRLPQYLQKVGRQAELLQYLSPDRLAMMVERSQSKLPVKKQAELGMNAAADLERFPECMRFGLQRSAVADFDACEILKSEIEARVTLGQYEDAVELANTAVLKQDRLRLMAKIGRCRAEQGLTPPPELIEEVGLLFDAITLDEPARWMNELAGDLLYFKPELALNLVDRLAERRATVEGLDWELVKLSADAIASKASIKDGNKAVSAAIKERIKDPIAARFSTTLAVMLQDHSAARVLAEMSGLPDAKDKLYLLRRWARHTRRFDEAAEVIEVALNMTVSTSSYSPHASHLRDLAEPLPFIANAAKAQRLISIFDAQKTAAERLGPTEAFVELQLLIARTEMTYDFDAAQARVLDVYFYIGNIPDFVTRSACNALLVAALPQIDPKRRLEASDGIHTIAEQDLAVNVDTLLSSTADHLFVTRNIVSALAVQRPATAIEIALKLNIEPSRDEALIEIISEQLEAHITDISFTELERAIGLVQDDDYRNEVIEQLCSRIGLTHNDDTLKARKGEIVRACELAASVTQAEARAPAQCNCIIALERMQDASCAEPIAKLRRDMKGSWTGIADEGRRIDTGFRIAVLLAPYDRDTAIQYAKEAEELHRNSRFKLGVETYIGNVRLAILAFAGLLPTNSETRADVERLKTLISDVPSLETRLRLWVSLALRLFMVEKNATGRALVGDQVKPLLSRVKDEDLGAWHHMMALAAPALYMANPLTAVEVLDSLPAQWRDSAYTGVITFLLRHVPASDPYDSSSGRYRITWEDTEQICALLPKLRVDVEIYSFITALVESARWKENQIPRSQQLELARRLESIVQTKLPAAGFISHNGFRVIAMAQVARLNRTQHGAWKAIIDDARAIPNSADRAMVLSYVAKAYTASDPIRLELLKEARALAMNAPSLLDKVDRLEMIADCASDIDQGICFSCLKDGIDTIATSHDPDLWPVQRRLVDLAHKVNKDMASSFAEKLDDDPARRAIRSSTKKRLDFLELKQTVLDGSKLDLSTPDNLKDLPQVAWTLVGALNANRAEPHKISRTLPYLKYASTLPLSKAYPIMAWVIENATKRVGHAAEAKTVVRGLFEATLLGCDLAARLSGRASKSFIFLNEGPKTVIHAGEREKALHHIREWLSNEVKEYLKITDPYFGPEELSILQSVLAYCPTVKVTILTSKMHQERLKLAQPWESAYQKHWSLRVSDQKPPSTKIMILGLRGSGDAPIHDRWLISAGTGLRLGTSLNSLGISKDSDISRMDEREAREHEAEVDQFIVRNRDEYNGQLVSYTTFYL